MSDMVENVARSLFDASPFRSEAGPFEAQTEVYQRMCRLLARAALMAVRNLDETTFALALHDIDDRRGPSRESKQVFREFYGAVFDAALKGEAE